MGGCTGVLGVLWGSLSCWVLGLGRREGAGEPRFPRNAVGSLEGLDDCAFKYTIRQTKRLEALRRYSKLRDYCDVGVNLELHMLKCGAFLEEYRANR